MRGDAERARDRRANTSHVSDAEGIETVGLLDAKPFAVPASPPTAPGSNRQTQHTEGLDQGKTSGVDSSGVPKRQLRLSLYVGVAELGCGLVAFGSIAVMATEHEVTDPIGTATAPGHHVIDLKGGLARPQYTQRRPNFSSR